MELFCVYFILKNIFSRKCGGGRFSFLVSRSDVLSLFRSCTIMNIVNVSKDIFFVFSLTDNLLWSWRLSWTQCCRISRCIKSNVVVFFIFGKYLLVQIHVKAYGANITYKIQNLLFQRFNMLRNGTIIKIHSKFYLPLTFVKIYYTITTNEVFKSWPYLPMYALSNVFRGIFFTHVKWKLKFD